MGSTDRWIAVLILILASVAGASVAEQQVLSFEEWRQQEVKKMHSRVVASERAMKKLTAHEFVEGESQQTRRQRYKKALARAKFNLELVKELSVTDYFVLYLSKFEDKKATFQKAAKRLSPEQMAELMMAYEKEIGAE